MATVTIEDPPLTISASPAVSILNLLLREGVKISHNCGGKAQCGTCRIEILDGERFLSPVGDRERSRLNALNCPPNVRLACQTYAVGDIRIRILLSGGE